MTTRDDNRSPPNNNGDGGNNASPSSQNNTKTIRTTHAQHGIYNALLNTTSSSSTQPLNELQILEKSISLTAAAPPLKLAPPFPGPCNALTPSIISAVQQQRQRASANSSQQQSNQTQSNNNNNQMLNLGGISHRVAEENASAWRDADPSKTHAVVVALCLGRAAWDFPSDDAPVDLVNKGAPPLLAVEISDNKHNNNNNNISNMNDKTQNIFGATTNYNTNGQDGNFHQQHQGGGVALYLDGTNSGNHNNGNQNGNNGNNNNNNQRIILNQNNINQQQAALAVLQALAAKDAAAQLHQQNTTNVNKERQSPTNVDGAGNQTSVAGGDGANGNNTNDQQHHQIALQAAVAAANNTNQPTIHPPGAPSTLYSWRALRAHSDVANRSCARAGEGLEALYLEMMKQRPESKNVKVITPLVNPTTENIRDVLHKGASDANDEMHRRNNSNRQRGISDGYTGPNKILLHYVGHGVPRPERGCMYFARQATQRQHHAFSPVRDILHLLGTPCMLLCDCASAGNIRSAIVAVERELNPYSNNAVQKENRFFWGSCADGEPLPHHPLMPDDLFSSIMVSPIRMAVLFFIVQRKNLYDLPPYLIHVFANEWGVGLKAGSPVAEVRNAFNAIVESIAAKVLSPDVFYVCFRQDAVVMNLFRAFILAQRIIGSLGCEPCSHPHIPPDTTTHALWQSFDLVVEGVLGSIMRQWRPKPSHGLSVHAFRMSLDPTLVMKNMPESPEVPVSSFFHDSLVSLQGQFDSAQALALVSSSIVEPPSTSQSHHTDLLVHQQYQNHLFNIQQQQAAAAAAQNQYGRPSNAFQYYNHNQYNGGGGGGSSGGGSSYHHPSYGNRFSDSENATSYDSSGSGGASDFASYLISRSNGSGNMMGGGNGRFDPIDNASYIGSGLEDQQQIFLSQNDEFPSRDLISFVGTRFPILQHAIVGRDTRFYGLVILARWLDLGSLAVECCELFGFFREMLFQLWHMAKPVDDQDALMVMIGAKTCMVDPRLLLVQKSLQHPVAYCARVFSSPQEPKDSSKLGILGQANTQRWFASATIALSMLRQPNLIFLGTFVSPIAGNNAPTTAQSQQQQQLQIQINPFSQNLSLKFQCPTTKTCIEILETPIPAKSRNAPDSDAEPSIASNLKSGCLAILGCIAFSLRDVFINAYPSLSAVASATTSSLQQNPAHQQQQQQQGRYQQQQQDPYVLQQQLQLFQLQHLQSYLHYQPTNNNQKQLSFLTQFLLPSLKESWIDGVGVLLSHKDSTPRIRWGSARTLHIFLNILNKIQTEALLAQQHVHLITSNVLGGNTNPNLGSPTGPLIALNTSLSNSTISTPVTQNPASGHGSIPITPSDQMKRSQSDDGLHNNNNNQNMFHNPQQNPNVLFLQSFYPQVQHHLAFLHDLAEMCQTLQVSVVSRLVTHSLRLEGNIDVRREILGALTAFCLCQTDGMLSGVIQSEMRALFTGTASPNRFGFANQQHQHHSTNHNNNNIPPQSGAPSTLNNTNNNITTNPNSISPGSQQLLQNLSKNQQPFQQKQYLSPNQPVSNQQMKRTSDFDPTVSSNLSQNNLLLGGTTTIVSSATTPQVSAINTPSRPPNGGGNVAAGVGGGEGSFLSRNASRLDGPNNATLLSPGHGVVRSVPFNQQQQQSTLSAQQNLFGASQQQQQHQQQQSTTPKNTVDSQVFDLSAETNAGNQNQTFSMDEFCPSFEQLGEMFIANNNNMMSMPTTTLAAKKATALVDRRTIVLLLAVRWILSLRQDAHPVLRVLCIRALQKFVAEKFITVSLFSKPKVPSASSQAPRGTHQQQNNNNIRMGSGIGPMAQNQHNNMDDEDDDHHNNNHNDDDDDELGYGKSNRNNQNQGSINESFSSTAISGKNPPQQKNQQQQQEKKGVFGRITDFFGGNKNTTTNNNNKSNQQQPVRGILSSNQQHQQSHHHDPYNNRANPSDLDKFLFSETDASILFDFEAPPLSLLDLESSDIAIVEFVNEMFRALAKPVIPRICQRISLGDLPARFSRPQTTAAAITSACSAPLIGDVAPHRCVFHSYVRRTLSHAKAARNDTALSDIVQRHVYPGIDAAHVVFHPNEPFAVCCSYDEVLSVVSTAPRDKRIFLSERMDRILPNGVDETDFGFGGANHHQNSSRLGAGDRGAHDSSDGDSYRTPRAASGFFAGSSGGAGMGGLNALSSNAAGGAPKKTSAVVLLDAVYSHTAAIVASDSSVRIVTDIANRGGIRIATAFQGLSSSFDTAAASLPHFSSPNSSPSNFSASQQHHQHSSANSGISSSSLAAYQPLGQRLIVTGDGHRFALWDIGQQRKLDERFALPATVTAQITSICPFAASPESFVLGLTKSIAITDHRMKDATAGTLHIPQAFAGAGCVSIMSHPGSQNKITGISYSGLTCIWDVRYAMEIGENRSILPGYGQTVHTLQPGLTRHSLPRAGYLPGISAAENNHSASPSSPINTVGGVKVTTAAIHPLFSEAPLVAGGIANKFKVTLPDQVLAHRNDYHPITCAWHPFEVVGAVVPWTSEVAQRRIEIFAAASKDQRADHIVDLIL